MALTDSLIINVALQKPTWKQVNKTDNKQTKKNLSAFSVELNLQKLGGSKWPRHLTSILTSPFPEIVLCLASLKRFRKWVGSRPETGTVTFQIVSVLWMSWSTPSFPRNIANRIGSRWEKDMDNLSTFQFLSQVIVALGATNFLKSLGLIKIQHSQNTHGVDTASES